MTNARVPDLVQPQSSLKRDGSFDLVNPTTSFQMLVWADLRSNSSTP